MITRNTFSLANELKAAGNNFISNSISAIMGTDGYPMENILHRYRVFNYRVTLAIVSSDEYATQSYKKKDFDWVVLQSHGKIPEGGVGGMSNSKLLNDIQSFVSTIGATTNPTKLYDFLLEDLQITSYMSGERDWTTDIRLKVLEPYGMDTFLKNILAGLTYKGYSDMNRANIFVLKVDFIGYPDNSEDPEIVPYSTRYWPVYISNFNCSLTQQGASYSLSLAAFNDAGKKDDLNVITNSISIKGDTVSNVMKSLETAVNEITQDNEKDTNFKLTKYKIVFLNEEGKEVNGDETPYGKAKMFDPISDTGSREFLKNKQSYVQSIRVGDISTSNDVPNQNIVLAVNGKHGMMNIIDNIITDSYYVVDKIRKEFKGEYDLLGQVPWWRVVPKVENGEFDKARNIHSRIVTYQIVPRRIHYSKLLALFKPAAVTPGNDFEKMCARKYEWQYTGNNKDILSFNLNFDQLWTKIITGKYGKSTATPGEDKMNATKSEVAKAPVDNGAPLNAGPATITGNNVAQSTRSNSSNKGDQVRPGSETSAAWSLARDVSHLMNNPMEAIETTMEILGDPMWLGTQFIDNSSVVNASKSRLFTTDGGIAMRTVDPIFRVVAYAPTDINSAGFLTADQGVPNSLALYSAYYTVQKVESYFSGGVFKQKLTAYRPGEQNLSNVAQQDATSDRFTMKQIDLSIRK